MLRAFIKSALLRAGLRVLRESHLPYGFDPLFDLKKITEEPITTVVDVGANIGQSVKTFLKAFPSCRIIACEPVPASFKELDKVYGSQPNVACEKVALDSSPGSLTMELLDPTSQLNRVRRSIVQTTTATVSVSSDTLDNLVRRHSLAQVDLLKIDTEGYELQVLQGGDNVFKAGMVRSVLAECCFDRNDSQHSYFFDIYEYLEPHGFNLLGLYDIRHLNKQLEYCNTLFYLPNERRK